MGSYRGVVDAIDLSNRYFVLKIVNSIEGLVCWAFSVLHCCMDWALGATLGRLDLTDFLFDSRLKGLLLLSKPVIQEPLATVRGKHRSLHLWSPIIIDFIHFFDL